MARHILNSFRRREIPGRRDLQPREAVIPARCGIHKRPFLMLMRSDATAWKLVFSALPPQSSGAAPSSRLQLQDSIELPGALTISSGYPGCPCCGDDGLIQCGCGAFSCKGAAKTHGDHTDYLCGTCDTWGCCRGARIGNIKGFANAARWGTRPHMATEVEAGDPAGRALARPKRPELPPPTSLQRS